MAQSKCTCGSKGCSACSDLMAAYWCDVCDRPTDEKRCPTCGLKARKIR